MLMENTHTVQKVYDRTPLPRATGPPRASPEHLYLRLHTGLSR